jgi:hypothetical protein
MKTALPFYLIILSTLILNACGQKDEKSYVDEMPYSVEEELSETSPKIIGDERFSVGMGLMVIKKAGAVGFCTSFMIDEKHIMTNSHCLSEILDSNKCSQNMVFHIKTEYGFRYNTCKRIVSRSNLSSGAFIDPDYAVIELSKKLDGIKAKSISREGVKEDEALTIESADFLADLQTNEVTGVRKVSKCIPKTNSVLGTYLHPKSSIIPFFASNSDSNECKIIQGNSGSPVMNSENKVVSVLFATFDKSKLPEASQLRINRNAGLATNLACVKLNLKSFDERIDADCGRLQKEEKNYYSNLKKIILDDTLEQIRVNREAFLKELPASFDYEIQENSLGDEKKSLFYTFEPKCVKPLEAWPEKELIKLKGEGVFGKKSYQTSLPSFTHGLESSLDDFLRPIIVSEVQRQERYKIIIEDIRSLDRKASATLRISSEALGAHANREITIPVCQ